MTTIAAMQCVEKGFLSLDGDVTDVLPELKGRQILKGFEEGSQKPILVENTKKITLRYGFEVWLVKRESDHVIDICSRINLDWAMISSVGSIPSFEMND